MFRDYGSVWMAIQVGAETLDPRIRVASGRETTTDRRELVLRSVDRSVRLGDVGDAQDLV